VSKTFAYNALLGGSGVGSELDISSPGSFTSARPVRNLPVEWDPASTRSLLGIAPVLLESNTVWACRTSPERAIEIETKLGIEYKILGRHSCHMNLVVSFSVDFPRFILV
jgi:hypothetical protein